MSDLEPRGATRRLLARFRTAGVACGLLLASAASAGTLQVEMLDVGQGDGILITSPEGKRILIDAGVRKADVVGQLQARGVAGLDLVIATHPHADHIGGMADVLTTLPVRVYTDSGEAHTTRTYQGVMDAVEERDIPYRPAEQGQRFKLDDGIVIDVLHPDSRKISGTRSDLNSNSVVVRMQHQEVCFLFTGDSEEPTEHEVLRGELESCEVLKVAHHGSAHSTTSAWLRTVQPEVALISCGVDNRYGHPAPDTVSRLESAGAAVYRTDTMGSILVESDGRRVTVTPRGKAPGAEEIRPTPFAASPSPRRPAVASMTPAPAPGARAPAAAAPAAAATETPVAAAPPEAAGAGAALPGRPRPGVGPSRPGAKAELPVDCAWVASRNSRVYHPGDCHVVNRIWEGNRVCFVDEAGAQASGRSRSQSCRGD